MGVLKESGRGGRSKGIAAEKRLGARSVSRGIGIGRAVCLHGRKRQFYKTDLKKSQVESEIRRFNAAVRLARMQLKRLGVGSKNSAQNSSGIFEVHLMMLDDSSLIDSIEKTIRSEKVNAEWAVKLATDSLVARYRSIPDEHIREKVVDIEDVSERITTALGGRPRSNVKLEKGSVIVAKEVKPSTLLELIQSRPKAIITENGGWTSHTFILARESGLPAVTGVKNVLRDIKTGDEVIVDGFAGQVIVGPSEPTLTNFRSRARVEPLNGSAEQPAGGPAVTLDGHEIQIRANVDMPGAYRDAQRSGARGVGLFRSEFLFNQFKGLPSESEQVKAYRKIGRLAGKHGVRVRTFDVSADQLADQLEPSEKNPALGLRAIRLSLERPRIFRTQLRALIQAAAESKIDIVLPMVTDISEIAKARKFIDAEKAALKRKGVEVGEPRLGIMVETPSAVMMVDEMLDACDFLSLGTNDLVQYLLAVDRDNSAVAEWFRSLHPAVTRSVSKVLKAGRDKGKPVIVCGEMAGSPFYVPVLIGLGATELSMNVNAIGPVRKVINGIAYEEAVELARDIESALTPESAEKTLTQAILDKWQHLFPKRPFLEISGDPTRA